MLQQVEDSEFSKFMAATPTTFTELVLNNPNDNGLQAQSGLYLCQNPAAPASFVQSWIIDADDTLWEDNIYYEQIINELIDCFIGAGITIDRKQIRAIVNEVELEVVQEYGFGALGFDVSMRKAFRVINERFDVNLHEPKEFLDSVVSRLADGPREVSSSTFDTIKTLRERGDGLILFTQGPIAIQQAKVARSGLASFFDVIAVADNKQVDMYRRLIDEIQSELGKITVVGNSINSEVIPALELSLRAVYFLNPNTWHAGTTAEVDSDAYTEIHCLTELLDLVEFQ